MSTAASPPQGEPLIGGPQPPADVLLRDVHVLDPRAGIDARHDVRVRGGRIVEIAEPGTLDAGTGALDAGAAAASAERGASGGGRAGEELVDGAGRLRLLPAFFDPHVHLRTPGQEHKEDLHTGTRAAAAGGFGAVIAMPNTDPVLDSAPLLRSLRDAAAREARVPVGFLPAITRGLAGEQLTEMAELRQEGALGFTDDGKPVRSAGMLRKALQYQRLCGGVLALHEEDPTLSRGGAMHEGAVSAALGIAGIPTVAESTMVARDAALAGYEDGRVHFQHLSCAASVEAVADAKARGWKVSAEVCPHHLLLTERGRARPRYEHEDAPAARDRGRPPRADRGAARRHDRLRRHRPRAARARREGGAVRAGADGHHGPRDCVRRAVHAASCCPASSSWRCWSSA